MTRPRRSRVAEGLVGERSLVGQPYLADARLRAEYEAEIAPRTEFALGRIFGRELPPGFAPKRALDLGAGTGAAGRALRASFGNDLTVIAVDRTGGPGVDLVVDLGAGPVRPAGLSGRFELLVAAHLLNELALPIPARAARVLAWMDELLAPGGLFVIVEPALRETSRGLLGVRDHLVRAGVFVLAPCFVQTACPALLRERDWCHDAARRPGLPRVDFSYLVLARGARPEKAPAGKFRIVSDPLPDKGRRRLLGCGTEGRLPLVCLDRHRSETNAPFFEAERGDVVEVGEVAVSPHEVRIGAATRVVGLTAV